MTEYRIYGAPAPGAGGMSGDPGAYPHGVTRGQVQDAISAWRDGASFDAIHPLQRYEDLGILYDQNAMKDLARVITAVIFGRPLKHPSGTVAGQVVRDAGELPGPAAPA